MENLNILGVFVAYFFLSFILLPCAKHQSFHYGKRNDLTAAAGEGIVRND